MYNVRAQGVHECMVNVHNYYDYNYYYDDAEDADGDDVSVSVCLCLSVCLSLCVYALEAFKDRLLITCARNKHQHLPQVGLCLNLENTIARSVTVGDSGLFVFM